MSRFPAPTNFQDGQRLFYGLAVAAAGMVFCALGTILTGIIIFGPWSKGSETLRLYEVGGALGSYFIGSVAVIIGLLVGGPVGRFHLEANRNGVNIDANDKSDDGQQDYAPPPAAPSSNGAEGPHVSS